jgi:DNA (cytosine-5)-methyltransferase 1
MRCLDLFSGIGGFALACEWAGIETVAFCEIDPYASAVLRKHWPSIPNLGDIRAVTRESIAPVDLVCGGFPCQPYSVAGKQQGAADDRDLWPEMLRVVREFRPTWVCGENVAGFIRLGLDSCLADLADSGYQARTFVLPALAVGASHHRQRTFIIAESNGVHESGGAEHDEPMAGLSEYGRTVSDTEIEQGGRIQQPRIQPDSIPGCRPWSVEPALGRVANGVPRRVDRLKCLGNAVVPQQVYPILKAIRECSR